MSRCVGAESDPTSGGQSPRLDNSIALNCQRPTVPAVGTGTQFSGDHYIIMCTYVNTFEYHLQELLMLRDVVLSPHSTMTSRGRLTMRNTNPKEFREFSSVSVRRPGTRLLEG